MQAVSDSKVLALSSSVAAMAGDVAMGVTQILSTSAQVASAAGPVGYAIAACLYIASYATGIASGIVGQEDLVPKDYVKVFLSPLIPDPTFGTMVEMFDQAGKGNIATAYSIYMTQSFPAALVIDGMGVFDVLTGSSNLQNYAMNVMKLQFFERKFKAEKCQEQLKEEARNLVIKLKPKKFLYAYPTFLREKDNTKHSGGHTRL